MTSIESFFNGEQIVLEGSVVKKDNRKLSIQLHPGLVAEVQTKHIVKLEEATDPVTARTFIRVTLNDDADIAAVFQPKLARLALSIGATDMPFNFGGQMPDAEEPMVSMVDDGPSIKPYIPTTFRRRTYCRAGLWGFIVDDSRRYERNDWRPGMPPE
jgi:hypothetical protein